MIRTNPFDFGLDDLSLDVRPGVPREDRVYAPQPGTMPPRLDAHLQRATEAVFAKEGGEGPSDYLPADKVIELFEAVSFANQHHGVVLNGFLTVNWSWCGVRDPRAVSWLTTRLMNRIGKARGGASARAPLLYVHVHENALGRLHTHVLLNVPVGTRPALLEQVVRSVGQLTGMKPPSHTVDVRQRQDGHRITQQGRWLRYVAKSLDPEARVRAPDGRIYPLGALLQLEKWQASGPIGDKSRVGGAVALARSARAAGGHVSALDLGAFADLYDGWEVRLHRARCERERPILNAAPDFLFRNPP
ncbi:hypothetical protein [Methylobacterium sp. sgz302541]|uniref:hypothetical protein n=1 Tax=unclassified Methylobacterium TaxID=2615210 RepID=UPI003D33D185